MKYIRNLVVTLVWVILDKYQLFMFPLEFVIDGHECEHPNIGSIKVTFERVSPAIAFKRDDILVGVDALGK